MTVPIIFRGWFWKRRLRYWWVTAMTWAATSFLLFWLRHATYCNSPVPEGHQHYEVDPTPSKAFWLQYSKCVCFLDTPEGIEHLMAWLVERYRFLERVGAGAE